MGVLMREGRKSLLGEEKSISWPACLVWAVDRLECGRNGGGAATGRPSQATEDVAFYLRAIGSHARLLSRVVQDPHLAGGSGMEE